MFCGSYRRSHIVYSWKFWIAADNGGWWVRVKNIFHVIKHGIDLWVKALVCDLLYLGSFTANPQCGLRDCGRLMEVCRVSFFKRVVLLVLMLLQFRISFGSQASFMYIAWMRTRGVQVFLVASSSPNWNQLTLSRWPLVLILLWNCRLLYFALVGPTVFSLCWDPWHYMYFILSKMLMLSSSVKLSHYV